MKNKKTKRRVITITIVVGLVVLIVGLSATKAVRQLKAQFDVAPATAVATIDDIGVYISANGTMETGQELPVTSGTQGRVTKVLYKQGDFVTKGDVIATVDADSLDEQIKALGNDIITKQSQINTYDVRYDVYHIKSPVEGRVKEVHVNYIDPEDVENDDEDDDTDDVVYQKVQDVVEKHGSLVSIAVGTHMYVVTEENIGQYEVGMKLRTEVHDYSDNYYRKNVYVEKIVDGKVYVSIPTTYRRADIEATIYSEDGKIELGTGTTEYIDMIYVKGTRGTITQTNTYRNERVDIGEVLYVAYDYSTQAIRDMYNELEDMEADLYDLKEQRENVEITAPVDGFLTTVNLSAGNDTTDEAIAFYIADTTVWNAIVAVDELDINQVKDGMSATVAIDAITDEEFNGTVTKISSFGANTSGVTTYDVTIEIPANEQFKLSMNASAEILIKEVKDAVTIPIEAVKTVGDKSFVMIYTERSDEEIEQIKDGILERQAQAIAFLQMSEEDIKAKLADRTSKDNADGKTKEAELSIADQLYGTQVMVETGIQDETSIEIVSGLNKGDVVLLPVSDSSDYIDDFKGMMIGSGAGNRK